ncbi:hypothetical protein GGI12_001630 [Dipsacomyces acuminosporus]|nr:hypothetical protein GGI12_001630 [Dipsacomyces acuminosporus]
MNAERVLNSFTQTADLPSKSQKAILSVYVTLASTVASSIIGYYVSDRITFLGSGLIPALGVLVATVALFFIPATNANLSKRRSLLWLIGWLMGAALRPLLQEFFYWGHEALVYAALGSTFVLFTSFSLGVLSSNRRQVIYLVSSMFFALCTFGWIRLLNFFYPTNALLSLELLLGLASTCAYTIMHTQMMLDDIAMGVSADPIWYSLTFFNDLVQMFIRLLVILANNKERRDREEEGDRDKRRRRNQARTGAGYTSYRSKAC